MVDKFSDSYKPTASKIASVRRTAGEAIFNACSEREAEIAKMDATVAKLTKAFRGERRFTVAEVDKVISALNTFGRAVNAGRNNTLRHLSTALVHNLPTAKLVAHAEDYAALGAKIAILHQVANASVQAEENADTLMNVDQQGFLQPDGAGDVMDELPQTNEPVAPAPPAAAPTAGEGGDEMGLLGPEGGPQDMDVSASDPFHEAPTAPNQPVSPSAPAPAPMAPAAPKVPVSASGPALASMKRRADGNYERYDVNGKESDKEPVGTPQDGGASKTRSGEDPWKPPFVRSDIPMPSYRLNESDKEPVGVPNEFGDGGKSDNEYSRKDPGTKAPTTTLSKRNRSALPDFLNDKKDEKEEKKPFHDFQTHGSEASEETVAQDGHNPLSNDVTKSEPAWPTASRKPVAKPNGSGEEPDEYSREEPGTVDKNVKAAMAVLAKHGYQYRKAFGDGTPVPGVAPKADPLEEVQQQAPEQDLLSDKSGMDMAMDFGADEHHEPDDHLFDEQGEDGFEMNQANDIDAAIASDILGSDFSMGGDEDFGGEEMPGEENNAAPGMDVGNPGMTPPTAAGPMGGSMGPVGSKARMTAKSARLMTASSTKRTAGIDLLDQVIAEDFL